MIEKSIAIGALARNCEEHLSKNIERIEELRNYFSQSSVFLYENNSTDHTKAILKEWQEKRESVYLLSEDIDESVYKVARKEKRLYGGTSEGRIRKMCDCRNKLLGLIKNQGNFDYVIFIDIDIAWFSVEGVIRSIENAPEGWGGLFSNCFVTFTNGVKSFDNPMHYDTFAYVEKGMPLEMIAYNSLNVFRRQLLSYKVYKQVNDCDFFECQSAFGGIGIYKGTVLDHLRYELFRPSTWKELGSTLCEHIYFNERVEGRIFVSKEMKVCYQHFEAQGIKWCLLTHCPLLFNFMGTLKRVMRRFV